MITPRFGRRVRAQRRARAAGVFALAAALIAGPLIASPAPAVAAEDVQDDGVVELSLSAGMHGVMQAGSPLLSTVTIENGTEQELSTGQITIEMNRTALADSAALTTWLESGVSTGSFVSLGTESSAAVAASETSTTSVLTPVGTLGTLPVGIYPIRVNLTADAGQAIAPLSAQSVLIVSSGTTAQVTVLVPITATPADGGLLTAEELTALTDPDGALTAQLDGIAGTSAALAIDPLIPAAIRALGTAAPVRAVEWLERLEGLPNDRFALQPGDADAATQSHADLPELLTPLPLTPYLNPTNFSDGTTPSPAPETPAPTSSPSPTPTAPPLPTDDELMALAGATPGVMWPQDSVDTADLSTFTAWIGLEATTILPSTAIAASSGAVVDIDGSRALVYDATGSAALSAAAGEPNDAAREQHISEGLAQLSFTGPAPSLLVGLDRDENRTAEALRETILSVSSFGDPTALSALNAASGQPATLRQAEADAAPSADRASKLSTLMADETRLTEFATILDDPLVLLSPERLQVLRVLATADAEAYATAVAAHRAATVTTLDAVGVQEPSAIQLFTSAAPLPVWVRNDLPWPVNVQLSAKPSDARLDVQPTTDVPAGPASNTRVKVPVEARVGSGALSVHFSLSSPTGVAIGTDQSAAVTVRAEWETIGLGILGGVIALFLVLGIARTVIRRRKDRSETDETLESSSSDASPTGE